ncbi:MAG: GTPase HflX, partial [Planctomycetota bacterium]|nr:GTPase HflX [Planctomycetota bacterium]
MGQRKDRTELTVEKERCFLVAAIVPGRYAADEDPLEEIASLVETAGGVVVGSLTQRLPRPHPKTYVGTGKFDELAEAVAASRAETLVVDDSLSGKQIEALESGCHCKVIDRSEVILDIFASRARSYQAKLQVELAQLRYQLPRQVRRWTHLERLGGGIGTRGPGERQLESDRRMIRKKIRALEWELKEIEARKAREVQGRREFFTACLVGYTNAGKSSLLNRLTGAETLVADRLFSTLDTLTRKLELPDAPAILISDTVGFIRRLPHHLVASFHATLEEAAQADLLLHVVDAADHLAQQRIAAVESTLAELGMEKKERLTLFNKWDAVKDVAAAEALLQICQPALPISAHT